MTARTTRNKLRHQAEKVMNDLDRATAHLKYLDDLSGGESDYIQDSMPILVYHIGLMKDIIKRFREGL
ncbi:unnamed protein product [marine sediment metagenome]|uniref:Uncharacterized protein n=1 Tax=marine sediment metagenome TaxID=412755 RepID=X1UML7_9ZZZZ